MSSVSTTPIDLFQNLSLDSQMSVTSAEIRSRADDVRDVLSSFDRDILPSEFKPGIFSELDRPSQNRPPVSQWTIQEDLASTLLQWGVYNDQAYSLLISLQSASTLARCFYEKLGRRFTSLFDDYDRLSDTFSTARDDVHRIAQSFRNIVAAVQDDRSHRQIGHEAIVRKLLEALIGICRRHVDILPAPQAAPPPRRGTRRTPSSSVDSTPNLFDVLIKNPVESQSEHLFMLDLLETFPAAVFVNLESEHTSLVSLLEINDAPKAFKYRVGRLPSGLSLSISGPDDVKAASESAGNQPDPAVSSDLSEIGGSSSQTQAQTRVQRQSPNPAPDQARTSRTGSKRAAEEPGTSVKRGRKKQNR